MREADCRRSAAGECRVQRVRPAAASGQTEAPTQQLRRPWRDRGIAGGATRVGLTNVDAGVTIGDCMHLAR